MSYRTHWDEDFLNNLTKGFEPLAKNDFACIIMQADSSLIWILARNKTAEPYHLIWKLTYQNWKNLLNTVSQYSIANHSIINDNCECSYAPIGSVRVRVGNDSWVFHGVFPYFVKAVKHADGNILKFSSFV